MLIDITRLPKAVGPLTERNILIFSNNNLSSFNNVYNWPYFNFRHSPCLFGSNILHSLGDLFKLTYLSFDSNYLIEVVVEQVSPDYVRPIYVKIIDRIDIDIAVSFNAVRAYQSGNFSLEPFHHLLNSSPLDYVKLDNESFSYQGGINYFIPAIFGENNLKRHLFRLQDILNEQATLNIKSLGQIYKYIYIYTPHVAEAFINGRFTRNPLHEVPTSYIYLNKIKQKFSFYETAFHQSHVRHHSLVLNHKNLDDIVFDLVSIFPTDISFTYKLTGNIDDLDLLSEFLIIDIFNNPYSYILREKFFSPENKNPSYKILKRLENIFYKIICFYAQEIGVSEHSWSALSPNYSSITICKNAQDEVMISINDRLHNHDVIYYSYFPLIALGTLGVGSY